ncbi:S8 family peptidase [Erythrobacter sp. W53]|uniref:S8 family peptidase n=1 Tax=Erythrobacter sp. W53 TaxID=3425947 RepID=UPI003D7686CD
MSTVNILIELEEDRNVESAASMDVTAGGDVEKTMKKSKSVSAAADMDGVTLDMEFGVTALTDLAGGAEEPDFAAFDESKGISEDADASQSESAMFEAQPDVETCYVVRASVEEKDAEKIAGNLMKKSGVRGVYADVEIQPSMICPGSPPLGTDQTVERLLCTNSLKRVGADGDGVLVAIVDTGINMAHMRSRGKRPGFDATRSWVPRAGLTPGNLPVGHGTMCAYDVTIAAPKCTLLDIALLQSQRSGGGSRMSGLLSDAVRAYQHLIRVMRAPRRPGETRSLVVNNSWGMFHPSWDFPVGHPSNYSDNPHHPFNRIVGTLAAHGADILFAAGNCGSDCPDGRCRGVTSRAIYGANSHPQVMCVAGVDTGKTRVGYSSKGPGRLRRAKPDISGYTHFRGSRVYAADGGTSAACPVVAGVVAAIRTKRPYAPRNPTRTPAAIRNLVTSTAQDLGTNGYDFSHGHGVVNGCAIARRLRPIMVDICRIRPQFCRPIPLPPDFCRRFPRLCNARPIPRPPFPPRPIPIPPLPLPGQSDGETYAAEDYEGYDAYDADHDATGGGVGMLDLSDPEALEELDMDELADLFYYIGQYHAAEGSEGAGAPPRKAKSEGSGSGGGGCGCG